MKRQLFALVFTSFMIGSFFGIGAAAAQDTPTAEQPTQEVMTATPPPETPTAEATAEPTKEPEQKPLFSTVALGELLLFLGLAALAGGGIVAIVLSFLGKKEVRDRVEDARNSWSKEQQQMLADFTAGFQRTTEGILDFLRSVQDGQPNVDVVAQVKTEVAKQLPTAVSNEVSARAAKS